MCKPGSSNRTSSCHGLQMAPKRQSISAPLESGDIPESDICSPMMSLIPVVNDNEDFWKNVQESALVFERRKRRRLQALWHYCPHCLKVKNGEPLSLSTLVHLASDPNHLQLIMKYDEVKDTKCFTDTIFMMNRVLWHCSRRDSSS